MVKFDPKLNPTQTAGLAANPGVAKHLDPMFAIFL